MEFCGIPWYYLCHLNWETESSKQLQAITRAECQWICRNYHSLMIWITHNRNHIYCPWYGHPFSICVIMDHDTHNDVIKWKNIPRYWPFVRGIHRSPVNSQRPVTRSFGIFFDLRPNKRLSKQSWGWWFETPSRSFWRHCNEPPSIAPRNVTQC